MKELQDLGNAFLYRPDSPSVGNTLIIAGFVPAWFDSTHLSLIYYACLIPPAAYHLVSWIRKTIIPAIKEGWDKFNNPL